MDTSRFPKRPKAAGFSCSREWENINMTEEEEDLIFRMYKLVGDRWELIAGRVPGKTAEEVERYWLLKHGLVSRNGR